jgi:ribosomal protein L7/L12
MSPGSYDSTTLQHQFAQIRERFERVEAQLKLVSETVGVPYADPAATVPPEVVELARAGNTMEAIKQYRAATGAGLDEARDVVAAL